MNDHNVNAYVTKGRKGLIELEDAIVSVYNGNTYISNELDRSLKAKKPVEIIDSDIVLLKMLSSGHSQEDISQHFKKANINPSSLSSIEKRLNLLRKHFGANNAIHLVAIAKDLGLI